MKFFFFFFRKVDAAIVNLLMRRKEECVLWEGHESKERCKKIFDDYDEASLNYFIKCELFFTFLSA